MRILVVDGWTAEGNLDHERAGCSLQCHVFKDLIQYRLPAAQVTVVDTHSGDGPNDLDLEAFDAAVWTGGGGNIYQADDFNSRQLHLCERVLDKVPYLWGSCWGMQVVMTVLGGRVVPAGRPEIGIAADIKTRPSRVSEAIYGAKTGPFDAPAHHFDEIEQLANGFDIVAENSVTVQAVVSKDGRIFCVQYHPELPYDLIGGLLKYWEANYRSVFSAGEFADLLAHLPEKERAEESSRKIEFNNWLSYVAAGKTGTANAAC